jgi:hypothetical protein
VSVWPTNIVRGDNRAGYVGFRFGLNQFDFLKEIESDRVESIYMLCFSDL